jgi:murein DD-endopeptidase MepM/ murein hydrolase activator NlpD
MRTATAQPLEPPLQTLQVSATVHTANVVRDAYSVELVTVVQWPSSGAGYREYSDGFGYRHSPCRGCSSDHHGVDLLPKYGTEVYAIADAVVLAAGWDGGLGQAVTLSSVIDGAEVVTVYGHMQAGSLRVAPGQSIPRGTVLGLVGSTGASTGPHLHFEVHIDGVPVDPYAWIVQHANAGDW